MDIKLNLILGFVAIFIILVLWIGIGVSDLKSNPENNKQHIQLEGSTSILPFVGGDLTEPFITNDILRNEIVKKEGDIIVISSTFTDYDVLTGKIVWNYTNQYLVDSKTHKHVDRMKEYYSFPSNVQKQNYDFFHPLLVVPATLIFEKTLFIDDLGIYVFSCESFGNDLSQTYPQFSPRTVWNDITCEIWVEPVTGSEVNFEMTWDNYFIENGVKIPVEVGGDNFTEFTSLTLMDLAKSKKELYFFYDIQIPIILITIGISSLIIGIQFNRTRTQNELIIKTRDELIKKERLSSIGELSARIAHDLRNPLHVIKTSLELHDKKNKDYSNSKEKLKINRAIGRLSNQITDVLDYVKPLNLDITNTSIQNCLTNSLSGLIIPDNIKLAISENDYTLEADYKKLEIVFSNLIRNSIESIGEKKGEIKIEITATDKNIILMFGDTGDNIPEFELDKIFNSLFTTKQTGTGLGLVTCKNIIEQHRGTITAKNNPKSFTITLTKNFLG